LPGLPNTTDISRVICSLSIVVRVAVVQVRVPGVVSIIGLSSG